MIKGEWDEIYRKYGLEEIPWHTSKPEKDIVNLVKKKIIKPGSVLDVGSGAGTNSLYLASKGFKVTGVDVSPTAVAIANKRRLRRGLNCNYVVGNILNVRFNQKFNIIFDRGCFHHIAKKDKPRYIGRLEELLKKGGKLYLHCFSDKSIFFYKNISKRDIKKYFKDFNIIYLKESIYTEPSTGWKRHMYSVFMEKIN